MNGIKEVPGVLKNPTLPIYIYIWRSGFNETGDIFIIVGIGEILFCSQQRANSLHMLLILLPNMLIHV